MPLMDADGASAPGRMLGSYRLSRVLGRGGMGTVYLATDPDLKQVVIKAINPELADQPEFRERFRREVTAASRVRPFCTAPVLDAELDGDHLYIVTEYIEGPTLQHTVTDKGPLRGSALEGLAAGVATALVAIHSAGVVHRDLKPENILLSPYGPRVIDFGIARRLGTDAPLTQAGETTGTPSYMAPEGLIGQPITAVADVFSWGCVMAFAGTGRLPFAGDNIGEMLYKTVYGEPNLQGLEPWLRRLVAWATRKNPAERPSSSRLLEELTGQSDAARAARSTTVFAPSAPNPPPVPQAPRPPAMAAKDGLTRLQMRARVRRWRWAVAGAMVVVLGIAGAAAFWPDGREKVFTDDFESEGSGWPTGKANLEFEEYRDGTFVISQVGHGFHQVLDAPAPQVPQNLAVEASVVLQSSDPRDEAGVFCRHAGDLRYDVLLMRDGRIRIRKGTPQRGTELAKTSDVVVANPHEGTVVTGVCEKSGDGVKVTAEIGGREVLSAVDREAPLAGGSAGIVTGREGRGEYPPSTIAAFDGFALYKL